MDRRKFLAGLGSLAAGGSLVFGSNAAVDVWANRNAGVAVTTDADGLIGLQAGEENDQFVTTENGTLGIDVSTSRSAGLNGDARTVIDDIFRIRNQAGSDQVVWIKDTELGDLFGDQGPLHFFRGPADLRDGSGNGVLGRLRRVFSQIDPVPGTPDQKQRLSITGVVPAASIIGSDPPARLRKGWINTGHPVTYLNNGIPSEEDRKTVTPNPVFDRLAAVKKGPGVEVGNNGGRLLLEPGEEMQVGIAGDFSDVSDEDGNFDLGSVLDQIQVVSRGPDDARQLATANTEFNPFDT